MIADAVEHVRLRDVAVIAQRFDFLAESLVGFPGVDLIGRQDDAGVVDGLVQFLDQPRSRCVLPVNIRRISVFDPLP